MSIKSKQTALDLVNVNIHFEIRSKKSLVTQNYDVVSKILLDSKIIDNLLSFNA